MPLCLTLGEIMTEAVTMIFCRWLDFTPSVIYNTRVRTSSTHGAILPAQPPERPVIKRPLGRMRVPNLS
jgi:hypothetical protein